VAEPPNSTSRDVVPSEQDWLEDEVPQEAISPADLDDEELEAYAEECARLAALEEFEGIPVDDLFSWSDDEADTPRQSDLVQREDSMDMS
jgi:hypothetical protein